MDTTIALHWQTAVQQQQDPTLSMGQVTLPVAGQTHWQHGPTDIIAQQETVPLAYSDDTASQGDDPDHPPFTVQGELGRYSSHSLLGAGGMGAVYLGAEEWLQRPVALKVLNSRRREEGARQALWNEAQVAARLDHPAIVPVHDGGDGFVVMRHIQGQSWAAVLGAQASKQLNVDVERLVTCCEALASAHARGVVHRDIKPANIMIGSDGQVLVLDWGLALTGSVDTAGRWHADQLDSQRACAGTPQWLSPEAAQGDVDRIGPATDVWGLGAILWALVTGRPLNHGSTAREAVQLAANAAPMTADRLPPNLPTGLRPILIACLDPEPSKRLSAEELGQSLQRWLQHSDSEQRAAQRRVQAEEILQQDALHAEDARRALHLLQEAAELDPELDLSLSQAQAHCCLAQEALAQGDVLPAQAALAAVTAVAGGDPGIQQQADILRAQLDQQRSQRQRRERMQVGLRLGAVAGLVATGAITIWIAGAAAALPERDQQRRHDQAQAVLATAPDASTSIAQQQRLRAGMQAAALAPENHAGPLMAAQAAADLAIAAAANDEHVAAARQLEMITWLLEHYPGVPFTEKISREIPQELQRLRQLHEGQRQEEVDRRLQVLAGMRSAHATPQSLAHRAEEVASWDGDEHWPELLTFADGEVLHRQLFVRVLSLRSDIPDEGRLVSLLEEGHPALIGEVLQALGHRQHASSAASLRGYFLAAGDALYQQPQQRQQILQHAAWIDAAGLDHQDALRWAWAQGDVAAYDAALALLAEVQPSQYRRGAELAWAFAGDMQAAQEYAGKALAADADDPQSIALCVELALQQQDLSSAQDYLEQARERGVDSPLLGPWQGWLALQAGNASEAEATLPALSALPTFAHGRWAKLRLALGHDAAEISEWKLPISELLRAIDGAQDAQLRLRLAAHLKSQAWGNQAAQRRLVRSLWQSGQRQRADDLIARSLADDPQHAQLYATIADLHIADQQAEAAYIAVQQAHDRARTHITRRYARIHTLQLARILGDDAAVYRAIANEPLQDEVLRATLASVGRSVAYSDPEYVSDEVLRIFVEDGHLHHLITRLRRWIANDPYRYRPVLNDVLLSIPAMRDRGWPGCREEVLAERCLYQAMLLIEDERHAEAEEWLALARQHDQAQHLSPLRSVIEAFAQQQPQLAHAALQDLAQDDRQLIHLPWVHERHGLWQDWAAQRSEVLRPRMRLHRPLSDMRLSAEDVRDLQEYYRDFIEKLPPPRLWWAPSSQGEEYQPDMQALDHLRPDPDAPPRRSLEALVEQS